MTCLSRDSNPRQSSRVAPDWDLSDALLPELSVTKLGPDKNLEAELFEKSDGAGWASL